MSSGTSEQSRGDVDHWKDNTTGPRHKTLRDNSTRHTSPAPRRKETARKQRMPAPSKDRRAWTIPGHVDNMSR